jgi:hypothetical protein
MTAASYDEGRKKVAKGAKTASTTAYRDDPGQWTGLSTIKFG